MAIRHQQVHGVYPAECHLGAGWGADLAKELAQMQMVDRVTLVPYVFTPAEVLQDLQTGKVKLLGMTITVDK